MALADFPHDFLWGASTSAYQYEGAYNEDGKGLSVQDVATPPAGTANFQLTSDGYHRYPEDFALFGEMGMKSYRFSIAWTRIFPNGTGEVNQAGLDYYQHVLDELKKYHIEPVATLFHFDLPAALQKQGGWANRATIEAFVNYAKVVLDHFSPQITYYQTINEQNMLFQGAVFAAFKGHGTFKDAVQANHNMFVAAAKVITYAHENHPEIKIGPAPNLVAIYPLTARPEDVLAANTYDSIRNLLFGDVTILGRYNHVAWHLFKQFHAAPDLAPDDMATIAAAHPDLLYFNYYNSETVRAADSGDMLPFKKVLNPFINQNEFGWDIDPEGFRVTLRQLYDRYNLPMIITENGLGAHDTLTDDGQVHDPYRIKYLNDHIYQMRLAIGEGIPVIGYHPWSAIDLVSTHQGFVKRYGFIYVDRGEENNSGTLKRYKKDSFAWYKNVIAHNGDNVTGPMEK